MVGQLAVVKPPSGKDQSRHRSQILQIVRSERLIDTVRVNVDGRLRTVDISWDDFWKRSANKADGATSCLLDRLRQTHRDYVASGFALADAAPYCRSYFRLLRNVILAATQEQPFQLLLRAVVGFACFSLRWPDQQAAVAAGTVSARNPVYLLAKLRQPEAYDDPKFLPLIAPPQPGIHSAIGTGLYYHYRQIRLSSRDKISLLACPTANPQVRIDSFDCLQTVFAALTFRKDPRSARRAGWIVDRAIAPFLRRLDARERPGQTSDVRVADLGGGSGALLRDITIQLALHHCDCLHGARLDWTVVDVKLRQSCFKSAVNSVRRYVRKAKGEVSDFREWVEQQNASAVVRPFTVVLLARLLNNMSEFTIKRTADRGETQQLAKGQLTDDAWARQTFVPHVCLRDGLAGVSRLIASNARVRLGEEKAFSQLSLSDYFRGLALINEMPSGSISGPRSAWFPVRRFNQKSLLLRSGGSILQRLCQIASLIVIEDVDLDATAMIEHLSRHQLTGLAASDATDRLHMQGSNLICASARQYSDCLPGRRFW